jgi:serine protease AprX
MATPLVAGCAAVVVEWLAKVGRVQKPSAALVKALLINGARAIPGQYVPTETGPVPNGSDGYGRVDLAATIGPYAANEAVTFKDEANALNVNDQEMTPVNVAAPATSLKVTLVWTDPPGDGLQNDLDLIVRAADGSERHGNVDPPSADFDRTNNVEQVVWQNIPPGNVTITVRAFRITQFPQPYALVVRVS